MRVTFGGKHPAVVIVAIVLVASLPVRMYAGSGACFRFDSPRGGSILTTPLCTVSLAACEEIESVRFQVRYLTSDGVQPGLVSLGRITRPPYKAIWNADSLPNQDYTGLHFLADIARGDGRDTTVRQEGVFLVHRGVESPSHTVPYLVSRLERRPGTEIRLGSRGSVTAAARTTWDQRALTITVRVQNPLFYEDDGPRSAARLGCDFVFDISSSALPYPSDSVITISIPLEGEPQLKRHSVRFEEDGTWGLETVTTPFGGRFKVERHVGKGWLIRCVVDRQTLGLRRFPASLRANLIARIAVANDTVRTLAWAGDTPQRQQSPLRFGTLHLHPLPLVHNPLLQWVVAFLVGFAAALVIVLIVTDPRPKAGSVARFELTEEEKHLVEQLRVLVENQLTDRTFDLVGASRSLRQSPRRIDTLLRRHLGKTFDQYLTRARIDVARERLRSSNSSEKSIAEMCGFASVNDLENAFRKLHRMTPYTYRMKQQVT